MITRIHHVGVVVRGLEQAYAFWRDTLGLPLIREAEVPDQGVRAALLACGPSEIELIEPMTPETSVARFLTVRGGGLHHLCFESDDVAREVRAFWSTDVPMIDRQPRVGLVGMVAFVHPRACAGILIELATPVDHAPLPASPLAMVAVQLSVEDVRAAAQRYRDLFGLTLGLHTADWSVARLAVGGVTVQLSPVGASAPKPRMSALRLSTPDVAALGARLAGRAIEYQTGATGLALGSTITHGVPLIIGQAERQEGHA